MGRIKRTVSNVVLRSYPIGDAGNTERDLVIRERQIYPVIIISVTASGPQRLQLD